MSKSSLLALLTDESGEVSRRKMMRQVGGAALAMASIGVAAGCGGTASFGGGGSNDFDILNFALNLEYMEAEFYTFATTGGGIFAQGVPTDGVGIQGVTTGGSQVTFSDSELSDIAVEIAADERAHVLLLRSALGNLAVAKPAINLNALGFGFASQTEFLALARAFEDVGVSAYNGAMANLDTRAKLETSASLLAAESQHAANIRLKVKQHGVATVALDTKDVLPPPTGTKYFSLDANAEAAARTTTEEFTILYGGVGLTQGAFFPGGFNGKIKS